VAELQRNLAQEREEKEQKGQQVVDLKKEIEEMGKAQASMELRLEEERKTAMEVPSLVKSFNKNNENS
jgi:uncharacterized coiled-coil DUF342 family protein